MWLFRIYALCDSKFSTVITITLVSKAPNIICCYVLKKQTQTSHTHVLSTFLLFPISISLFLLGIQLFFHLLFPRLLFISYATFSVRIFRCPIHAYSTCSSSKTVFFLWWRAPQQMLRTQPWGLVCNGAPVEWNWQGKPKYSGKTLSQCHFVHHKSHMDWPGTEPGPPQWEASD
jgi:hypothetical protein